MFHLARELKIKIDFSLIEGHLLCSREFGFVASLHVATPNMISSSVFHSDANEDHA